MKRIAVIMLFLQNVCNGRLYHKVALVYGEQQREVWSISTAREAQNLHDAYDIISHKVLHHGDGHINFHKQFYGAISYELATHNGIGDYKVGSPVFKGT